MKKIHSFGINSHKCKVDISLLCQYIMPMNLKGKGCFPKLAKKSLIKVIPVRRNSFPNLGIQTG